ncbi:MAG: nucleoside monophosphate kinase, partial [Bacteroidota bacterium]
EMKNDTELGLLAKKYIAEGVLVPDEVTIGMLKNKVNANPDVGGYIFDGFPRNVVQAKALDEFLEAKGTEVKILVALDVEDEEIVSRILSRGESSGRADDKDETIIRGRIDVYENETTPVFDYYEMFQKSTMVDGMGSIEEIFDRLCKAIEKSDEEE